MKKLLIRLIEMYQKHISKWLESNGATKGIIIGICRIIRCNPFSKGGYDPLK